MSVCLMTSKQQQDRRGRGRLKPKTLKLQRAQLFNCLSGHHISWRGNYGARKHEKIEGQMHVEAGHHQRVSGRITGDIRINSKSFACQNFRTCKLRLTTQFDYCKCIRMIYFKCNGLFCVHFFSLIINQSVNVFHYCCIASVDVDSLNLKKLLTSYKPHINMVIAAICVNITFQTKCIALNATPLSVQCLAFSVFLIYASY